MQQQIPAGDRTLLGRTVVITRPAGTAVALAQKVRARGGIPLLLPGLSLRSMTDSAAAAAELRHALTDDLVIFSSPAAMRFASKLLPLTPAGIVLAVGKGTALALARQGIHTALVPARQDSEGLLEHPALQAVQGWRIALIGAPGGRGLLREQLLARGAQWREVHVYQRVAPRLDRRHAAALLCLPDSTRVLVSSAEALSHLCQRVPPPALARLFQMTAVVSSERLALAARAAGFVRVTRAASALSIDLLAAAAMNSDVDA